MKYEPNIVICDIQTYRIMTHNQNYMDRLYEAYQYIKKEKMNTKEKFATAEENLVGLFTYEEITIFDRLKNEEYKKIISASWDRIHSDVDAYIKDKEIGDRLASYGRLGYTPYRKELIEEGVIFTSLTEEEQKIRNKALADIYEEVLRRKNR